ncbi:MAG: hypothetical protein COS42_10750 [Flavobacteriales bacterium CG03_land_8_20_14_0_80_35_15]|nr:gluconate 2-dehydrogenase subunit 3 family protein [Zetaproteobacteria bacterium]OIO12303.1 MAG: hypothetical protein AUJ53_02630 [Flavobacteriaceae bacterium CG1_02_35_72]PIR12300.1 MAG: hypothetical protein COV50_09785 [Flavobacteriales bacterium CG11_big_fil_rev_8_21_14_0_20_35_7]PIV16294.1 MAG: hypothetical protein COS42_10750 [Flavobacteriales bacterium CG03_land_8_20_14_0_80_35_15]PIX06214.1 MAG: hypothetical protein COZ76_10050 [Flavobacteriales bacterium CG_4_8_14_3_um_filter_35_10]
MERRDVLKGLGLSLGFVVVSPSLISLLQSCNRTPTLNWQPAFFDKNQIVVLTNLVDLILPKTADSPGALDVNVPQFIDAYAKEVANAEAQKNFTDGLTAILKELDKSVANLKTTDYDGLLKKYFKATAQAQEAFKNNPSEVLVLNSLTTLRSMSIWAYKTSEEVGEKVLAYNPIPGEYKGCLTLQEASGGKAWSL